MKKNNRMRVKTNVHSTRSKGNLTVKGSLTVETALTLPLFFLAVVCLVYLMELQAIQFSIHNAAQNAAKKTAVEVAALPIVNPWKLEADIVNLVGAERLEQSIVEGGSSGLNCWLSYFDEAEGVIHVNIWYKICLPFPRFLNLTLRLNESFQLRAWTGCRGAKTEAGEDEIVYITDYGTVYHEDYQCKYLKLSIRYVPAEEVEGLRNLDGGIYYPCERCVYGSPMAGVYITDYGSRYHNSLNCNGLKRTIRAVRKSEVAGRGACSNCAQ